jgi:hypothetical protein
MPDADPKQLRRLKIVSITALTLFGLGFGLLESQYNNKAKPNLFVIDNARAILENKFDFSKTESDTITHYLNEILSDSALTAKAKVVSQIVDEINFSEDPLKYKSVFDSAFDNYYKAFEKSIEKHPAAIDKIIPILNAHKSYNEFSKKINSEFFGKSAKDKYKQDLFKRHIKASRHPEFNSIQKNAPTRTGNSFAGNSPKFIRRKLPR